MLITLCSLFAEEIVLSWNHPDSEISFYRWRNKESEWTLTANNEILITYDSCITDEYHIQASPNGENWSADHTVFFTSSEEIEVVWTWIYKDDKVSYYRWRLDGGEWNIIDSSLKQVRTLLKTNGRYNFEVCGSYDGVNWSKPVSVFVTAVRITPTKKTVTNILRLEASVSYSLSYAFYDFYNGHHISDARYLMTTVPSFTVDGEILLSIGKRFRLFAGYAYSRESKRETVIPYAFIVEHHQVKNGFDILLPIKDKWRVYLGLDVAYSLDVNAGYWSPSCFFGCRIGLDYFINEHCYVGIKSGVRVAHNDAEDPLYRSKSYLFDPIGIKIGVRF